MAADSLLMVFEAYIDDSRSSDDDLLVLAGHVATAESWAAFSREWEQLLPYGGMRDKDGEFHFKWSEIANSLERRARIPAFYKLIRKYVICSISASVSRNVVSIAKKRVWVGDKGTAFDLLKDIGVDNPYLLLFRALMSSFHQKRASGSQIRDLPDDATIDFIFDEQTEESKLIPVWDEFVANHDSKTRRLFGLTPRFESDKKFLPLQAADLWAGYMRSKITPVRFGGELTIDAKELGAENFPPLVMAELSATTMIGDIRSILHRMFPGEIVYNSRKSSVYERREGYNTREALAYYNPEHFSDRILNVEFDLK